MEQTRFWISWREIHAANMSCYTLNKTSKTVISSRAESHYNQCVRHILTKKFLRFGCISAVS